MNFQAIQKKVQAGKRLNQEDLAFLFDYPDLLELGRLAMQVRQQKNGRKVYYNINRHINYSNVCYVGCKFCEFGQPKTSKKAYELSMEQMEQAARQALAEGATEFHIVGGLHPDLKLNYYENLLRTFKKAAPKVHLKAFTAVELDYFAKISRVSIGEVIDRLVAAGLGSFPGGGAEVLTDRVHQLTHPNKIGPATWLDIHRLIHQKGFRSNATMLYGHVETVADKVEHLQKLRDLQDETGGFQTFIPLSFVPEETPLKYIPKPTAVEDLRHIAVSRLFLDNFDHIKAYWVMMGLGTAQLSLSFGADDLDGTLMKETIVHMAGAKAPEGVSVKTLINLIKEAGFEPVERDTLYQVVERVAA